MNIKEKSPMTYKFSYVTEPGKTRIKSFKTLKGAQKGAIRILRTPSPRFDGDYFIGRDGICLVPMLPFTPEELFPMIVRPRPEGDPKPKD